MTLLDIYIIIGIIIDILAGILVLVGIPVLSYYIAKSFNEDKLEKAYKKPPTKEEYERALKIQQKYYEDKEKEDVHKQSTDTAKDE